MKPLSVDAGCLHGFQHERGCLNHLIKCFETPSDGISIQQNQQLPNNRNVFHLYALFFHIPVALSSLAVLFSME